MPRVLERVHVVVAQAEMMTDFVHQDVGDEMLERVVAVRPFVEDRAAEQADAVGQRARMVDASLGRSECPRRCR